METERTVSSEPRYGSGGNCVLRFFHYYAKISLLKSRIIEMKIRDSAYCTEAGTTDDFLRTETNVDKW